jgi:hypothetical protein
MSKLSAAVAFSPAVKSLMKLMVPGAGLEPALPLPGKGF